MALKAAMQVVVLDHAIMENMVMHTSSRGAIRFKDLHMQASGRRHMPANPPPTAVLIQ